MRLCVLALAASLLQSCASPRQFATPYVIDNAQGINYFYPNGVENAYFDDNQKEFVICVTDRADDQIKDENRFTLKIPENFLDISKDIYPKPLMSEGHRGLRALGSDALSDANKKGFYYAQQLLKQRGDRVYGIYATVENGCHFANNALMALPILRDPTDINTDEAQHFKGNKINEMLSKDKPFMVLTSSPEILWGLDETSPCISIHGDRCLLLATKSNINTNNKTAVIEQSLPNEILHIRRLTSKGQSRPLWYMAMPFAGLCCINREASNHPLTPNPQGGFRVWQWSSVCPTE